MLYRTRVHYVDAVQFDPHAMPWPECVKPWPPGTYQPRDMSWGYIEFSTGRVHVRGGEWIVTREGKVQIFTNKVFHEIFESAEPKPGAPFVYIERDEWESVALAVHEHISPAGGGGKQGIMK